jgi:hypothetical protein
LPLSEQQQGNKKIIGLGKQRLTILQRRVQFLAKHAQTLTSILRGVRKESSNIQQRARKFYGKAGLQQILDRNYKDHKKNCANKKRKRMSSLFKVLSFHTTIICSKNDFMENSLYREVALDIKVII